MIDHLTLAVLLVIHGNGGQETMSPASPVAAEVVRSNLLVRYRFANANFLISRIELTIDGAGRGRLTWSRRDVSRDQSREVLVSEQGVTELREILARLDFVNSREKYQTVEDHSNLGETQIQVDQAGVVREVTFNYTKNKDADALGRLLRGIANREMYVAELEVAMVHQPLEMPAAIATLTREFKYGRIGDAVALLPLLTSIADDAAFTAIARNRASDLARLVREQSQKQDRKGKGR